MFGILLLTALLPAAEPVGKRPYEMDWAGRTQDARPPLVAFEDLSGWTVECKDAQAQFTLSREQPLWDGHVGKLVYRGTGNAPRVTLRPPKPIAAPPLDSINLWVHGNNWAWMPDPSTPPVEIAVLLRAKTGQELRLSLGRVIWQEWWLMHQKLRPDQQKMLGEGAVVEGIEVSGGRNRDDRTLYFDNLALYVEPLPPLVFEPRPLRNLTLPEGQTAGTNNGPGRLPFPTREQTLLPDNLTADFRTALEQEGDGFVFHYRGADGHLAYRYAPKTGTLGDVTAQWEGRNPKPFSPMAEGGVQLVDAKETPAAKLVSCKREGDAAVAVWELAPKAGTAARVQYTFRLWQKSLVVDVACRGGQVGEVRFGKAVGLENPRLVTLPYLMGEGNRPAVLVSGHVERPLFLMGLVDHCRSNASSLWFVNGTAQDGTQYNGGSRYLPKTDGQRNDCYERLLLTVSPRFEEVLPNVPNPKSPWMHVAGRRVWIAHGASNRDHDYQLFKQIARHGMTEVAITDHETGWRDGGESFTFRTRAAPGKGGDPAQADYAKKLHALGFRYGIYNNYTDFAPVNEFWHEDLVTRRPDGQWQAAWPRCYNPKPARAVEFEARLAPVIQQKFQLDTAYCDVHTAVTPWQYCDFDARVPGAGTFAATFYAYGEIMLHQKKTWNGPVYSEGNNHWYYCGLTDGNYGQDQAARLDESPWLVDFDLRKLHPLCCNFGMGNPGMFYPKKGGLGPAAERDASLDRFLAATLAFGHTGFLVLDGGMATAMRSYYNVQAVHAQYAEAAVEEIRYGDGQGNLLDPSQAVATGAYKRSQVLTRYANGVTVAVNGHRGEDWRLPFVTLPPNGWLARNDSKDPAQRLFAHSGTLDGRRVDYVDAPAYLYADGRGRLTTFAAPFIGEGCPRMFCDGPLAVLKRDQWFEAIPGPGCTTFGFELPGGAAATAEAIGIDVEGKPVGPAKVRMSGTLAIVAPMEKAFSYRVSRRPPAAVRLQSKTAVVVPGQRVAFEKVVGDKTEARSIVIPVDAKPGTLFWHGEDGAEIGFQVVPLAEARLSVEGNEVLLLKVAVQPAGNPPGTPLTIRLGSFEWNQKLGDSLVFNAHFPPRREQVVPVPLTVAMGDLRFERTWHLKTEDAVRTLDWSPESFRSGLRLRKGEEQPLGDATGAQAHWSETSCGGQARHSLFMHPPYQTGPGYVFAVFEPVELPKHPVVLRCRIGKADGSDPGDGILFKVAVLDGSETVVAQKQWIEHAWTPLEADLARWAGKPVRIKLIADVGPADNSSGDWACWADLRLESAGPVLVQTLHESAVELQREPGPYPLSVSPAELRQARRGVLHFEGMGLESSGRYISTARLNGVPLGNLPGAGGDEVHGIWAAAALPLTPAAIAALGQWNTLAIENPGEDSFKVRRFWIELELADGRRLSSQITRTAFTQPPEWKYAEGTGVPLGKPIELLLRFQ